MKKNYSWSTINFNERLFEYAGALSFLISRLFLEIFIFNSSNLKLTCDVLDVENFLHLQHNYVCKVLLKKFSLHVSF